MTARLLAEEIFIGPPNKWQAAHEDFWPMWWEQCPECGHWDTWCSARWYGGAFGLCDGCAGYPFCGCRHSHTGPCTKDPA